VQLFWINEHFDTTRNALLSPDKACAFEGDHHLVDRRWGDAEVVLDVGFGRRPAV